MGEGGEGPAHPHIPGVTNAEGVTPQGERNMQLELGLARTYPGLFEATYVDNAPVVVSKNVAQRTAWGRLFGKLTKLLAMSHPIGLLLPKDLPERVERRVDKAVPKVLRLGRKHDDKPVTLLFCKNGAALVADNETVSTPNTSGLTEGTIAAVVKSMADRKTQGFDEYEISVPTVIALSEDEMKGDLKNVELKRNKVVKVHRMPFSDAKLKEIQSKLEQEVGAMREQGDFLEAGQIIRRTRAATA